MINRVIDLCLDMPPSEEYYCSMLHTFILNPSYAGYKNGYGRQLASEIGLTLECLEATAAAGGRKINLILVSVIGAASVWAMVYFTWPLEYIMLAPAALSFAWYRYVSYKQFGGITGDTAGYFVVICETAIAAAAAITALAMPI